MAQGKYETHVKPKLKLIEGWAREGLIEKEICKRIGISEQTLNVYKKSYPELVESLKKSKQEADYTVVDSLFKRANGMEYQEVIEELRTDKKTGEEKLVIVKRHTKFFPPDPTSAIFWLKNRDKANWSDSKNVNVAGTVKLEDFFKE